MAVHLGEEDLRRLGPQSKPYFIWFYKAQSRSLPSLSPVPELPVLAQSEAGFADVREGCAGSRLSEAPKGEIPPYLYASSLQFPSWLDLRTDNVLLLVTA